MYFYCFNWLRKIFRPGISIKVVHADSSADIYKDNAFVEKYEKTSKYNIDINALALKEDDVLESRLRLPRIDEAHILEAVSLHVESVTPFLKQETDFGWIVDFPGSNELNLSIAITSKAKVLECIEKNKEIDSTLDNEVWYINQAGIPIKFNGYGDQVRTRLYRKYELTGVFLCCFICAAAFAAVVTPTAQLRLRAIESYHQYEALVDSTKTHVQKKNELLYVVETSKKINELLLSRTDMQKFLLVMTEVFPDDTHITNLDVTGLKVKITGTTSNSNNLMKLLGERQEIKNLRAPVPVTRQPGSTQEGFSLEFNVDPDILSNSTNKLISRLSDKNATTNAVL